MGYIGEFAGGYRQPGGQLGVPVRQRCNKPIQKAPRMAHITLLISLKPLASLKAPIKITRQ